MSLLHRLEEAQKLLQLDSSAPDASSLRRAYRTALREHPPDRDPEGFRRIRAAYELLSAPTSEIVRWLNTPQPLTAPPVPLPLEPVPAGSTARALLRYSATLLHIGELAPELLDDQHGSSWPLEAAVDPSTPEQERA